MDILKAGKCRMNIKEMKFWPFKATFDNFLVEKLPFLGSLCNISTHRSLILKNKLIPINWILVWLNHIGSI